MKEYFIKKSRRSSSEDEKERTTIKISIELGYIVDDLGERVPLLFIIACD